MWDTPRATISASNPLGSDRKELLPHKASRRPSFEGQMLTWLTRILLLVGGVLASWFVAKVAPNYNVSRVSRRCCSLRRPLWWWHLGPSGELTSALARGVIQQQFGAQRQDCRLCPR